MFHVMAALGYVQALRKSTKHGRRTRALPNSVGNTQEMDRKKTTTTTHKLDRFDRILPGKLKSWDILHVDPNPQPPPCAQKPAIIITKREEAM